MDAESITVKIHLDTEEVRGVIDAMQAEIDGLRKDAERYRWLRKKSNTVVNIDIGAGNEIEDTLDEAIDDALSEEAKGTT